MSDVTDVQVRTTVSEPASPGSPVKKIIVAVHGVGDQYTFATIQSVVNQFCGFYNQPAGVPLGNFHTGRPTFSLPSTYPREPFERLAFAEVYWAKIPRTIVDDKHTLEESKKWAQTIVERLRFRWRLKGSKGGCHDRDFLLLKQVLSEMIQAVAVLDRLGGLGERAGLFTFDLRKLLDDYLGDVQIVTEFESNRVEIVQAFGDILRDVHKTYPAAEIFVIAHSEGTVVSLLGFLKAFREEERPEWINSVRGFVTLGSPIDKHLVLWPELFGETPPLHTPDQKIAWRNYYDRGDPIGFDLDDTRAWIEMHGWTDVFNFPADHDHGFTRYPFPGKAHVDYWTDEEVFGHFITSVVKEDAGGSIAPDAAKRTALPTAPPTDRVLQKWLSYIVPYVGIAALHFVAVYVLFKAVVEAIAPNEPLTTGEIFTDVARTSLVLLGITIAARMPRLTRNTWLRVASLAAAAIACAVYYQTAGTPEPSLVLGFSIEAGMATVILAAAVVALAYFFGAMFPLWGVTPLMLAGAVVVVGKVAWHLWIAKQASDIGPVWPVFLATAAFLYLWWLATLFFDLVVIWHWYIRHAQILARMDEILGGQRGAKRTVKAGAVAPPRDYAPQVQS
jgi:hypothetical protein